MIHVEGMGWMGSMTAWALARRNVPFTWNDTDSGVTAWRASTGAVYPSGYGPERRDWQAWLALLSSPPWTHVSGPAWNRLVEAGDWWSNKERAPHGGAGLPVATLPGGGLTMFSEPTVHVNVQRVVELTRRTFRNEKLRTSVEEAEPELILRAHGFNDRLSRYLWGWTCMVELDFPVERANRPCLYIRDGMAVLAYAYPVPGTPYWYAGSSLIHQEADSARGLEIEPKFERWQQLLREYTHGRVRARKAGPFVHGWRPSESVGGPGGRTEEEKEEEMLMHLSHVEDGPLEGVPVVSYPPRWHDGVRRWPTVEANLVASLRKLGVSL